MDNGQGATHPTIPTLFGSHDRRLDVLERATGTVVEAPKIKDEKTFSFAGALYVATSGPDHLRRPLTLTSVICLLGIPGSTATTVRVYKNGAPLTPNFSGTPDMVLGAGVAAVRFTFATPFSGSEVPTAADLITFGVTVAGTSATGLTCKALFG